jgi:hypothetical protein
MPQMVKQLGHFKGFTLFHIRQEFRMGSGFPARAASRHRLQRNDYAALNTPLAESI